MDFVPRPQPIFDFIKKHSGNSLQDMYSNYNMGAGYAIYLSEEDATKAQKLAKELGIDAWIGGRVEKGSRQVVIKPLAITFAGSSLEVR
jgi:phosphoribosylformylglycinamidine cyclo-ligase